MYETEHCLDTNAEERLDLVRQGPFTTEVGESGLIEEVVAASIGTALPVLATGAPNDFRGIPISVSMLRHRTYSTHVATGEMRTPCERANPNLSRNSSCYTLFYEPFIFSFSSVLDSHKCRHARASGWARGTVFHGTEARLTYSTIQ